MIERRFVRYIYIYNLRGTTAMAYTGNGFFAAVGLSPRKMCKGSADETDSFFDVIPPRYGTERRSWSCLTELNTSIQYYCRRLFFSTREYTPSRTCAYPFHNNTNKKLQRSLVHVFFFYLLHIFGWFLPGFISANIFCTNRGNYYFPYTFPKTFAITLVFLFFFLVYCCSCSALRVQSVCQKIMIGKD